MNRKQRLKNKLNAELLAKIANDARLAKHICEECGELGGHWVSFGLPSLENIMKNEEQQGFYTCHKFYGPDGKRLPEHTKENISTDPISAITELFNLIKDKHILQ